MFNYMQEYTRQFVHTFMYFVVPHTPCARLSLERWFKRNHEHNVNILICRWYTNAYFSVRWIVLGTKICSGSQNNYNIVKLMNFFKSSLYMVLAYERHFIHEYQFHNIVIISRTKPQHCVAVWAVVDGSLLFLTCHKKIFRLVSNVTYLIAIAQSLTCILIHGGTFINNSNPAIHGDVFVLQATQSKNCDLKSKFDEWINEMIFVLILNHICMWRMKSHL